MEFSSWFTFGGILLLTIVLFRSVRRARAGTSGAWKTDAREKSAQVRDEMDRLLVQLQEVSRENLSRIDHKIRSLNLLLQESRDVLAEMRKIREDVRTMTLAAPAKSTPLAVPPAPPPAPAPSDPPAPPVPPAHERIYRLSDQGMDAAGICRETGLEKGEVELILGLRAVPASKAIRP